MTSRLAVVAIDTVDPDPLARFWSAVLGWEVTEREDTIVCLRPADGSSTGLDLLRVPESKPGKNRLHLDLRADGDRAEELDRLLALGARRVDVGQDDDVTWTVLADPEGNEFCLL